ncbi:MAG: manganese catalase family protein, partial [Tetragenococcus koreensis]|nr:manganese catalase family protein [Tetragenococcus koreensis]
MFKHTKELQYNAKPEAPDPLMARRLQESLGGQWGEMTGMMSYLSQGWSTVGNEKYRDLLLDTGTEEIGHVEMLATMIGHLLEDAPVNIQENVYQSGDPALAAVMSGMDPNQAVVSGLNASLNNPNGTPWNAGYTASSGNLLADMRYNVTRESMGRLQVTRLYHMTKDKGIR